MAGHEADHPRIRGEHVIKIGADLSAQGSSPHTRGALWHPPTSPIAPGIIPAYAGSTRTASTRKTILRDHPRIRGEHPSRALRSFGRCGSSPHTRGARHHPDRARATAWIIPAYAGSTSAAGRRARPRADHPRIRGEHRGRELMPWQRYGSSPHTRGARSRREVFERAKWIIPAYAGSTESGGLAWRLAGDHPRIRGEHPIGAYLVLAVNGSSPHTRGARSIASKTNSRAKDHPRIRGEHTAPAHSVHTGQGSSPHTRGARRRWRVVNGVVRIIPAYAGSTQIHLNSTGDIRDHPRIRGEHPDHPFQVCRCWGSSPHTRGAPG